MLKPGLYPQDGCRNTESHAEQRVYEALKGHLPKGWFAWHSLRIRTKDGLDGEGDFVIAVPDRGMLVLEVKGGIIELRGGHWFQNNEPLARAPREQGNHFARALIERLHAKGCAPPAFGIATCFPDAAFTKGPTEDDVAGLVLGQQDLPWFGEALKGLLDRALPANSSTRGNWIEELHALWGETWTPRLRLGQRARMDENERLKLDEAQIEALDSWELNTSLLVEGAAGTGKTLLALEAARRFALSGKRTLLLCFTEPLAKWLTEHVHETALKVAPIKRFAAEILAEAGLEKAVVDTSAFWKNVSLRAATETPLNQRWDAIVLDEAQDLAEDDWLLVDELSREKVLWAFADTQQAFWIDRPLPASLFKARFRLKKRYRCPEPIRALADAYAGASIEEKRLRAGIEQGVIRVCACPNAACVQTKIALELDKLIAEGLKPQDIAVLSLRGAAPDDSIVYHEKLGRHVLVRADDPALETNVIVETFLRFKGLERPAIIITDLRLAQNKPDLAKRMYIAVTRATLAVVIVDTAQSLAADAVLNRLPKV